jgi:bifunctional non-homologous end joining protein LigD
MPLTFPVLPMKAGLGSLPVDDERWAYEIKWDGYRIVAHVDGPRLRLQSSTGLDYTARYPELAPMAGAINAGSAILDGEVVVLDAEGRPNFEMLQRHDTGVAFYAFDVLQIGGSDTIGLPYTNRRALLADVLDPGAHWMVPAHVVGGGAELLAATAERRLEGVMAKRVESLYVPGKRSPHWRKVKNRVRAEVTIGGWTVGSGNRSARFGSMLVGVPQPDGSLRFAGGVGTGFTDRRLGELFAQLSALRSDRCPFTPLPSREVIREATWVRPELRATIEITEFTNEGLVRHPSFVDLIDEGAG